MRKLSTLLFVAAFCALEAHAQNLVLECSFSAPEMRRVAEATRVTVADCATLQRVGAPLLPFRTLRVALPPGSRVAQVRARSLEQTERRILAQPVEHGRLPLTAPNTRDALVEKTDADLPDLAIYQSEEAYPPAPAEVASLQRLEGYVIALIRVYPVRYRPAKAELEWTRRMSVEIVLEAESAKGLASATEIRPQPRARERIANWVDNPAMLKAYDQLETVAKSEPGETYQYLLITKSNLVTAFQPLVDQKTQSGLSVRVETVESITNTIPGRDVPEKLRAFIRQAYETWGVRYVLLGGDVSTVPCRYARVSMGALVPNPTLPTDLYYACLDGSWNSDGDANWGEPNDGEGGGDVDLLAEVYVGRAPVDTAAEVGVFVNKVVRYATQPHANRSNTLVLAEFLGDTPSGPAQGGDMFDPLVPLFGDSQVSWLDDRFTVPAWVKQDALNAMNQSPHLVLFNGHGNDSTLIGVQQPFVRSIETPDIALLTNQWPFLACSVGCNVGQFDNDRFSPDAIGEELVKQHNRGAFAAIFNSRLGWYDAQDEAKYSGEFQARFFIQLLNNSQTNFGVANQLSKHDLVSRVESSGVMTYRWCYYEITLFGDPHLAWQKPAPVPAVTSQGTPHWWLASYGWTNNFEAAAMADTDHDGMAAWQEYVAGTSPVDGQSVFVASLTLNGSGAQLAWPGVAGRRYSIWGAAQLAAGDFVLITNNLSATPPRNTFVPGQTVDNFKFFRVGVELAP